MARSSPPTPLTCRSGASAPPQPQAAQPIPALAIASILPCLQAAHSKAPPTLILCTSYPDSGKIGDWRVTGLVAVHR